MDELWTLTSVGQNRIEPWNAHNIIIIIVIIIIMLAVGAVMNAVLNGYGWVALCLRTEGDIDLGWPHHPAAWLLLRQWQPAETDPRSRRTQSRRGMCCRTTGTPMAAHTDNQICRYFRLYLLLESRQLNLTSFLHRPVFTRLVGASPLTMVFSFSAWRSKKYGIKRH